MPTGACVSDTYRTVRDRASAVFEVRGSEFIGHVAPVETVEEAEAFVAEIDAEYGDATHNVPAYRVRADPFREYSNDDGEPSGSAGKPVLNVLQGEEIENVACVVTRYYGGTNLGYGGLVRAYSRAVGDAIEATKIVEKRPQTRFSITAAYDDSGTVRGIIESSSAAFDADYGECVTFAVRLPVADADDLTERLRDATSGRVDIE